MQLTSHCPACGKTIRTELSSGAAVLKCPRCGLERSIPSDATVDHTPKRCLGCGNQDLWRQKDFPQRVGLLMVALGAVFSSIAWGYHRPILALSILGGFAVIDMVLFWVMPDVLVCYRCRARHRVATNEGEFAPYNHELGERYRQEQLRVDANRSSGHAPSAG